MRHVFDAVVTREKHLRTLLLVAALTVFVLSVLIFLIDSFVPLAFVPARFIPSSLLATIVPALSVLLVYELLLLTLSVRGPFVQFVRREFEVISLIVLRDLFKKLDELSVSTSNGLLTELAVVAIGSIILYFSVEVLARIETRSVKGALKEDLPSKVSLLVRPKAWLELALLLFFTALVIYETIGVLVGVPGTGYNDLFVQMVFSGLIIFNMLQLFMTLLATDSYEVLFEHSALVLASVVVLIALSKDSIVGVPMIVAALFFVIGTLFLHGFARGDSLLGVLRNVKRRK